MSGGQEQQALVLAELASIKTWELIACVFQAREARREATEESNDPATRVAFQERERLWFERAFARLQILEAEAPMLCARLEELGYRIDNDDRDPNVRPPGGGAAA